MFKLFKILVSLAVLLIIAGIIIYFLPREIKIQGVRSLTGFVPESIKESVEEIVLTPPEQRARIIAELENQLVQLSETAPSTTTQEIIGTSEELIGKLKEKNEAASLAEILTNKIANQLIGQFGTSTTFLCPTPAVPNER